MAEDTKIDIRRIVIENARGLLWYYMTQIVDCANNADVVRRGLDLGYGTSKVNLRFLRYVAVYLFHRVCMRISKDAPGASELDYLRACVTMMWEVVQPGALPRFTRAAKATIECRSRRSCAADWSETCYYRIYEQLTN